MRYFAVQCNKCGHWQGGFTKKIGKYSVTCKRCNKSRQIHDKGKYNLNNNVRYVSDQTDLPQLVSRLNDKRE